MKISKNKYIILDRDGTLIEEKNYLHDPDPSVTFTGSY